MNAGLTSRRDWIVNQSIVQSGRSIDLDSIDVGSNPATLTICFCRLNIRTLPNMREVMLVQV